MKKHMILPALLLVLSVGTSVALMAAVPSVNISGVTGGATWLWLEAENALSTTGTGESEYYPNFTDSGFNFDNLPSWVEDGGSVAPTIAWEAHIPAAMSANTQMLAHCGSYYGRNANVSVDGNQVGTFAALPVGEYTVSGWVATGVGAISAGTHDLQMQVPEWDSTSWDGILLYDGDIGSAGAPSIQPEDFGGVTSYWAGATMAPSSRPIMTSGSVTPSFNVTGALVANYYVNFNGTVSTYVPGTALTQPGSYRVWVEAWGAVAADGLTPQERTLAGVRLHARRQQTAARGANLGDDGGRELALGRGGRCQRHKPGRSGFLVL